MQPTTRSVLLGVVLGGLCAGCMAQSINPWPESWVPFTVQVGECVIDVKVPAEGVVSRKPPARFIPSGQKSDTIAMFGYPDERFIIDVGLATYNHVPVPFKDPADFAAHLRKVFNMDRLGNIVRFNQYDWINYYGYPRVREIDGIITSAERYYYPVTSDYALIIEASYSKKIAADAKTHASHRAITREVVANVRISNCGYYQ